MVMQANRSLGLLLYLPVVVVVAVTEAAAPDHRVEMTIFPIVKKQSDSVNCGTSSFGMRKELLPI